MLQVELNHILREEDALNRLTEILSDVENSKTTYVLTKNGLPVVALVNPDQLIGDERLEFPVDQMAPAMATDVPDQSNLISSSSIEASDVNSLLNEKLPEEVSSLPSMPSFQMTAPVQPVMQPSQPVMTAAPAEATFQPVAPMAAVEPLAPVAPINPLTPVAPVAPISPVGQQPAPTTQVAPAVPTQPVAPIAPTDQIALNNSSNLPPLTGSLDLPDTDLNNSSPMA